MEFHTCGISSGLIAAATYLICAGDKCTPRVAAVAFILGYLLVIPGFFFS